MDEQGWHLELHNNQLVIISEKFGITPVTELYSKIFTRLQNPNRELLFQLINAKNKKFNIIDVTAGLGIDALLMANMGHRVTLIERNQTLVQILDYVVTNKVLPGVENLHLVNADSQEYLQQITGIPDIIYIDPMFQDNQSAKPKKNMQLIDMFLQTEANSCSHNDDNETLFKLAYQLAKTKIIVKRDNKQDPLVINPKASYSKKGKTIRYDVYVK